MHMLADMLTKTIGADSKCLLELVSSGHWTIGGDVRVREGFGINTENDYTQTSMASRSWLTDDDSQALILRLRHASSSSR